MRTGTVLTLLIAVARATNGTDCAAALLNHLLLPLLNAAAATLLQYWRASVALPSWRAHLLVHLHRR